MKKKIIFALLPVAAMSLTSCGAVLDYKANLDKYVFEMAYHEDFNILQMTDIHWNYNSSTMRNKQYLDKVFKQTKDHLVDAQGSGAKIDLVELTGDQFMLSNSYHVKSFIEYFEKKAEEYGFMYTVIWGNHDRHGLYNPNWLAEQFAKAKHCYYVELDDNLYGRSNFVINLNQAGKPVWQLYNLDSGASFSETSVSPFRDYDYIRKDQTDWFLEEHGYAKKLAGKEVPSIAYYHIPQQDNGIAWEKVLKDKSVYKNKFFKLEGFADNGTEKYASDFIEVARSHGLKGAFMGHAHNVDWTVEVDGVVIGLGVKTGTELYFAHIDAKSNDDAMKMGLESVGIEENFDLIGASLVTIKDDANFDLEHLYLNERDSGDFVRWVKW